MSDGSKIEWTDATWNPIRARRKDTGKVGWHCERVSPACTHCYAAAHNGRMLPGCGTGLDYTRYNRDQVDIFIDEPTLLQPLRWRKPRKVFVCSMTDLFGEFVPFGLVDAVFAVMALCPQHTFQVLTKRPERMAEYLAHLQKAADDHAPNTANGRFTPVDVLNIRWLKARQVGSAAAGFTSLGPVIDKGIGWPLPNVWLGTTVENQEWADKRIPHLLECDAAIRFLSCEPLLGPIDEVMKWCESSDGFAYDEEHGPVHRDDGGRGVRWVIVGGESGRGRRRMNLDWARSLRDQCDSGGVPFFMKQVDKVQPIPDDLMVLEFPQPASAL